MIKVVSATATAGEVELIVQAVRFFIDRLIPVARQKRLTLNIEVTDKPGRTPIAIKWLVSSTGLFGPKPPNHFEMTVSAAAGARDGLEISANEIVHLAQVVSGRLRICLKKRKTNSQTEEAYAASWIGGKFAFVDMTSRQDRLWETEAAALKMQLVDEFQSWTAGQLAKLTTQKQKKNGYGLYAIRPKIIDAPVSMPEQSKRAAPAVHRADHIVDLTVDDIVEVHSSYAATDANADRIDVIDNRSANSATDDRSMPGAFTTTVSENAVTSDRQRDANKLPLLHPLPDDSAKEQKSLAMQKDSIASASHLTIANHLKIDSHEFKIVVEIPGLGMDRLLDGLVLHGKLNDLLERGLIPYESAREAFLTAQLNQRR